jgi:hypothetical protein
MSSLLAFRKLTIKAFTLVDALTRMTQAAKFVGDRAEVDAKIGSLLSLAA